MIAAGVAPLTALEPSSKARTYREYASECVQLAAATDDAQARGELIEMAVKWYRLADYVEEWAGKDQSRRQCCGRAATIRLRSRRLPQCRARNTLYWAGEKLS